MLAMSLPADQGAGAFHSGASRYLDPKQNRSLLGLQPIGCEARHDLVPARAREPQKLELRHPYAERLRTDHLAGHR